MPRISDNWCTAMLALVRHLCARAPVCTTSRHLLSPRECVCYAGDKKQQREVKAGEQHLQRPTSPEDREAWKAHWIALGMPWRTEPEIDECRQRYLARRRDVEPDMARGTYPFRDENGRIHLGREDIEWLLATHDGGKGPVDWDDMSQRARIGLKLQGADLRGVDLSRLPLARLRASLANGDWEKATSEQREAGSVDLMGANLLLSRLEGASLRGAHLEDAKCRQSRLSEATLAGAALSGADLTFARLDGTYLGGAHLEANSALPGAELHLARMDSFTDLYRTHLGHPKHGSISASDVNWGGANVARTNYWNEVEMLGDEAVARDRYTRAGQLKTPEQRLNHYLRATRANRQVAIVLRNHGLTEHADRFAYRAQICQRSVFWRQHQWFRCFVSWILWLIAGYGYKPKRSFLAYLIVLSAFAVGYYFLAPLSGVHFEPLGAVVFSITSFHGRGFSPGESVNITNLVVVLAAVEAIIGLLIDVIFIATLTNRFFAR